MTYKQFKSKEKYIYYSPLFNELIVGGKKNKKLYIYLGKQKIAELFYIGEL